MKKQVFFLVIMCVCIIQFAIAQIPNYVPTNGLVAYWGFSGNANDSSGNNYNGTVNGATLTTDRFGNANSAYSFNGSSNYIAVPHNSAFNMQQATWNVWVKKTSSSTGNGMYIFGKRDNAQHHVTFCSGGVTGNCQLGWATTQATGISGGDITNGWHLISLSYDQTLSTNNLTLYYDGILQGTTTIQSFSFANGDIRFGIEMNNSYWQPFNGLIDDASIYNRILTQSEIQQLYSGPAAVAICPTITGTLTNGLVAYYPFCGNANEVVSSAIPSSNNATLTSDRFGNSNSAYQFTGNNLIKYLGTNPLATIGNEYQNFTLNFWLSPTDVITNAKLLGSFGWGYMIEINNSKLQISYINNSSTWSTYSSSSNLTSNQWRMATIIKSNSSIKIYLNGILDNTLNSVPDIKLYSKYHSFFGANGQDNNSYYNGTIDDIGIWSRTLTDQEISNLFGQNICFQSITVTDTLIINTGILSYNPITYNNTITIYPNPANDHITIDCGTLANVVGYNIKIINTLGQEVFSQPMNTQQYYVPLNSWTGQGIYFVNIIDAQGHTIDVRKIILQ